MKRVLVIDDDDDMRELMATILRRRCEVATAADGAAGLELAHRLRPDLLVLDLMMPRMHGYEVCARVRADPALKDAKILIATSKSYASDARTLLEETGADDVVVKPFHVVEFSRRVAALLGEPSRPKSRAAPA